MRCLGPSGDRSRRWTPYNRPIRTGYEGLPVGIAVNRDTADRSTVSDDAHALTSSTRSKVQGAKVQGPASNVQRTLPSFASPDPSRESWGQSGLASTTTTTVGLTPFQNQSNIIRRVDYIWTEARGGHTKARVGTGFCKAPDPCVRSDALPFPFPFLPPPPDPTLEERKALLRTA